MPLPGQFCLSGIVRGSWSDMFWLYPLGSCLSNSVFMHCGVSFAFLTAAMAGPDACFSWNWCALSEPAWRCAVHVRCGLWQFVFRWFFLFFFFFRIFPCFLVRDISANSLRCIDSQFCLFLKKKLFSWLENRLQILLRCIDSQFVQFSLKNYFSWLENSPLLVQSCVQRTAVTLRLL